MNKSLIFKICCVSALLFSCVFSCVRAPGPETAEYQAQSLLRTNLLITKYGRLNDASSLDTLRYLEGRFAKALQAGKVSNIRPDFNLLNTKEPFAYSAGGGHVVISKGLILYLSNEAELSFILAHELAHEILGHNRAMQGSSVLDEIPVPASHHERKDLELAADRYALGLVALAGYDPRASIGALINSYRALKPQGKSDTHPDLDVRIQSVYFAVQSSGWVPPGTIDRRSFRQLKRDISGVN